MTDGNRKNKLDARSLAALGFWIYLLCLSYPQRWNDYFLVAIFLSLLLGPFLFLLAFYLAASGRSGDEQSEKLGSPPKAGVHHINSSDRGWIVILSLFLGGLSAWLAPQVLNQPQYPVWARDPQVGWAMGLVIFLLVVGFDYQNAIKLAERRRVKRLRYFGLPLFSSSQFISVPYHLNWEWVSHFKGGSNTGIARTEYALELRAFELGSIPLTRFYEDSLPSLEILNETGQRFASWNRGQIFSYTDFPEYPMKP